jgi:hypothetical protein
MTFFRCSCQNLYVVHTATYVIDRSSPASITSPRLRAIPSRTWSSPILTDCRSRPLPGPIRADPLTSSRLGTGPSSVLSSTRVPGSSPDRFPGTNRDPAVARSSPPREDVVRRGFRSRGTRQSAGLRPVSHRLPAQGPGKRRAERRGPAKRASVSPTRVLRFRSLSQLHIGSARRVASGGAVNVQVQGLRHCCRSTLFFAFLVLFLA